MDLQERFLSMAKEPEYGPGVKVVEGGLGVTGHAIYRVLTIEDDSQRPLCDALEGITAELRLLESE